MMARSVGLGAAAVEGPPSVALQFPLATPAVPQAVETPPVQNRSAAQASREMKAVAARTTAPRDFRPAMAKFTFELRSATQLYPNIIVHPPPQLQIPWAPRVGGSPSGEP